jgi:ribosome-associated heat shock protein Hsp15
MPEHVRIDKWLWHARFYRSRVKAQEAASSGLIRLNGVRVQKPSADVRPGDVVTLPRGREILAVRIEGIVARRSCAAEGQRLYKILPEPS